MELSWHDQIDIIDKIYSKLQDDRRYFKEMHESAENIKLKKRVCIWLYGASRQGKTWAAVNFIGGK